MAAGVEKLIELTGSCEEAILVVLNLPPTMEESTATKRRREKKAHASAAEGDDRSKEQEGLSEYELQRLERIERNEQRLKDLGLLDLQVSKSPSRGSKRRKG
jgi:hypothetical protein